jgi:hypothetical protein
MACVVVPTGVVKLQPCIVDIPEALFLEQWVSEWGWEGAGGAGGGVSGNRGMVCRG